MIIIPSKRLLNRFSKKGRPIWQERYDRRERLLMFAGPLFWSWNDLNIIGPVPPEVIDDWRKDPLFAPIAKAVSSFPYGSAAAAGAAGGADVALSSITVSNIGSTSQQAGFQYQTDGDLAVTNSVGSYIARTNEWLASGDKGAGVGSDYEAYADETTSVAGIHTGGWTDSTTYYTISTTLQLQAVAPIAGSSQSSAGNTSVREIANTSNVATVSFSLYAERTGGIGGIGGIGCPLCCFTPDTLITMADDDD